MTSLCGSAWNFFAKAYEVEPEQIPKQVDTVLDYVDLKFKRDDFIRNLGQKGITRWWNARREGEKPSPEKLIEHAARGMLAELGMSAPVQETFRESITRQKRRELAALRCPDLYVLEQHSTVFRPSRPACGR